MIGLGYVGLPLALAFSKELPTIGFDIDTERVSELAVGNDRNNEISESEISESDLELTVDPSCIADTDFIVVTVPTPVTDDHRPDLNLLESASAMIGTRLRERSAGLPPPIIVYESTTYPGCTEEFCGPVIERDSALTSGDGFFLGYSPERTNFGDLEHTLETVVKVVSGQTPEVTKIVGDTYGLIAKAGIHVAADIKTAEASKVIENVQRDLNIALFNELAVMFEGMGMSSSDVFDAAATKWNFHRYQPGLVGGHCIPVDPYYLTHAAENVGYSADVVLAGRAVNESMPGYVAQRVVSLVEAQGGEPEESSALVLGLTFKKNVSDIRNSKAMVLADLLIDKFARVNVHDPFVSSGSIGEQDFVFIDNLADSKDRYNLVVLAVDHAEFNSIESALPDLLLPNGVVFDVTGMLGKSVGAPAVNIWAL